MAKGNVSHDANKALEFKELGNKCFQSGDYLTAEENYSQAIDHDPTNPLLYTNRAMSRLKLSHWTDVIDDSNHAIFLLPENMKAYHQLAQAQIALHDSQRALISAKMAHSLCVEEVWKGGKGASSLGVITELVLRIKKEDWERREDIRQAGLGGLENELVGLLREEGRRRKGEYSLGDAVEREYEGKVESLRRTFKEAGLASEESKRRKVPDWLVDDITFAVIEDPVVTKQGKSYDRSSIMEHLRRSPTDPLTREPLHIEDLRPNLTLKKACEEFVTENGWVVDW